MAKFDIYCHNLTIYKEKTDEKDSKINRKRFT